MGDSRELHIDDNGNQFYFDDDGRRVYLKSTSSGLNPAVQAAIVAGIFGIIIALIGLIPLNSSDEPYLPIFVVIIRLVNDEVDEPPSETPTLIYTSTNTASPTWTPFPTLTSTATSVITLTDTVTLTPTNPVALTGLPTSSNFESCQGEYSAGIHTVPSGTIVMADVSVNGVRHYDTSPDEATYGYPESNVVLFEIQGELDVPFRGGCTTGDRDTLLEIAQGQIMAGCSGGCASVRVIILNTDGQQECYYYIDEELISNCDVRE